MAIRADLRDVEPLVSRLISIGGEFYAKDSSWSHYKNNEDWSKVYSIGDAEARGHIEDVYAVGRDICGFMSSELLSINSNFTTYPTLTSIVDRFKETWVFQDLTHILTQAREASERTQFENWAFDKMLATFDEQLVLLAAIRETLRMLTESNLYRSENRMSLQDSASHSNISLNNVSNSAIVIQSENVSQTLHREQTILKELVKAIEESSIEDKAGLLEAAKTLESSYKTGSWITSYKHFMSVAADHLQVIQAFLPAISSML